MSKKTDFIHFKKIENSSGALLTVFLLTYNHADTIRETFESIISQNTTYNFIVKILEDCSSDDTLSICKEYVKKYPDLFVLINQPANTRGQHIISAMQNEINTPYWCFIEGDDYYTAPDFYENAISFLESHKDYNLYAGMHVIKDLTGSFLTLFDVSNLSLKEKGHDLSINNYVYLQTSARIYRNIFDFKVMDEYPISLDIYLYLLYLHVGQSYFYHHNVSIYRITDNGLWSHLSRKQRKYESRLVCTNVLKFYGCLYPEFVVNMYPKRIMKRISKIFGAKVTARIIWFYEKIFGVERMKR